MDRLRRWWKQIKGECEFKCDEELDSRRLPNGDRFLLKDFWWWIRFPDGEEFEDTIPAGTVSDLSSWPSWAHIPILMQRPPEERMDKAGWVHDRVATLIRTGQLDKSFFWTNKFWRYISRSGQDEVRVWWHQSIGGALGLTAWAAWRELVRWVR